MKKSVQRILDAIVEANHLGIKWIELLRKLKMQNDIVTLKSTVLSLIDNGYAKIAGGQIYATEFTDLTRDNDGSIPMLKGITATLEEEIREIHNLRGEGNKDLHLYGIDTLIRMLIEKGSVDPSDILRSVARVLSLDAMRMMRGEVRGEASENDGYAGCLLRDAGKIMEACYKLEN